jgi:hypothetical protein
MSEQNQSQHEYETKLYERKIRAAERAHDRTDKLEDMFNENSDRHAQSVIRIILTLNGGAGIALLAFVGGLASRGGLGVEQVILITAQLKWFVFGVLTACAAALTAYVVSYVYTGQLRFLTRSWDPPFIVENARTKKWLRVGYVLHVLGILLVLVGVGFFSFGMYKIQHVVVGLK